MLGAGNAAGAAETETGVPVVARLLKAPLTERPMRLEEAVVLRLP